MLKKSAVSLLAFAFSALVLPLRSEPAGVPASFQASTLTWVRNGEPTTLSALGASTGDVFLTIEQMARLSDAQVRWQAVSKQACLTRVEGLLCFNWENSLVTQNDKPTKKRYPLKFEDNQLLIPIKFTTSKEFQSFTGNQFSWDQRRTRLIQSAPVTVAIPPVEKLKDRYRLTLPIAPEVPRYLVEKSDKKIWIRFVRGNSEGSQIFEGDNVIQEVRIVQKRHAADLILKMGPEAMSSDVYVDEPNKKLIVEVFPSHEIAAAMRTDNRATPPPAAPAPIGAKASVAAAAVPKASKISTPTKTPAEKTVSVASPAQKIAALAAPPKEAVRPVAAAFPAVVVRAAPSLSSSENRGETPPSPERAIRTVVIDAGHGGMDSGAIGSRGTLEKNINLDVARSLAQALKKEKNVKVILTRDKDEFIALSKRTELANEARADLFVSIHCNASLSARNSGFEAYILSSAASDKAAESVARIENSVVTLESDSAANGTRSRLNQLLASMAVYNFINESSECAAFICKLITNKSGVEKTAVKEADFFVLRGAQMPAVLVELDYLSNPITELKLRSSRYQNKMVKGLTEGILAYSRRVQKSQEARAARTRRADARLYR